MNIVVCVKQVPDTSEVRVDSETHNLIREGVPCILNPFDKNALEEALRLRDENGGSVAVVSMGPPQASAALQECLQMGADSAVLLSDRAVGGSDTLATGYALSELIRSLQPDLVLCGNEAIDGCTGQVGPCIAENLHMPQLTYVCKCDYQDGVMHVKRDVGSTVECYIIKMPCVLCVVKGCNVPRTPGSTTAQIRTVSAADIHLDPERIGRRGSPTQVVKIDVSGKAGGSYVDVDDSLSWEEKIHFIINGGIEMNKSVDLWRGGAESLADRLIRNEVISGFIR